MKTVLSPNDVAHKWANQLQDNARNANNSFYFDGKTIYSYGRHFPIAVLTGENNHFALFTTRTYSVTTSSHISMVRQAASHKEKIYCYDPEQAANGRHTENIEHWLTNIDTIAKSLATARKPEKYFAEIEQEKTQLNKYLQHFNLKLNKTQLAKISFTTASEYKAAVIAANEAEKKANASKLKIGKGIYEKRQIAWRDYIDSEFAKALTVKQRDAANFYLQHGIGYDNETTLLRTDGNQIETSKGIKLSVEIGKRYFDFYNRIVSKGGCNGNCNYKMLEYNVESANETGLIVGCHNIPISEINLLASKLNWK